MAGETLNESKLCRLCSIDIIEDGVNIFDENDSSEKLSVIISKYLPIKVCTFFFPVCVLKNYCFHNFKSLILENESILSLH